MVIICNILYGFILYGRCIYVYIYIDVYNSIRHQNSS
jgi:hypothetical protein